MSAATPETDRSVAGHATDAMLAPLFAIAAVVWTAVASEDGLADLLVTARPGSWMALACGVLCAAALGILYSLGKRLPPVSIALAVLPALAGGVGLAMAQGDLVEIFPCVAAPEVGVVAARGVRELLGARMLGSALTAGLLAAVAITLGMRARRAETDGGLRFAATVAGGLAIAMVVMSVATSEVAVVLEHVAKHWRDDAPLRMRLSTRIAGFASWAPIALLPAVGFAARASPRAGAIAIACIAAVALSIDAWSVAKAEATLDSATRPPWEGVEGFEPARLAGDTPEPGADAIVTRHEWRDARGARLALRDARGLEAALSRLARRPPAPQQCPQEEEELPEWLTEQDAGAPPAKQSRTTDPFLERERAKTTGVLGTLRLLPQGVSIARGAALALDRRLGAGPLRSLLEAARRARVGRISLIGVRAGDRIAPSRSRLLSPFAGSRRAATPITIVFVYHPVPLDLPQPTVRRPQDEPLFWHGEVRPGPLELATRAGERVTLRDRSTARAAAARLGGNVVYLEIADDAHAEDLVRAADLVEIARAHPLVLDELPPVGAN